ncbi:uncharacterized protein LOC129925891 [Biomphalaria glabrata]|uniref:Uncharacterized protein LOC129925891 n=1 Tax=Biomphalaria glabrata TaxID=6526 RepID=A0A9W3A816_BIOGL|nr:uncharacterized protein LOC129925891 [Biomphalaria glabrata]
MSERDKLKTEEDEGLKSKGKLGDRLGAIRKLFSLQTCPYISEVRVTNMAANLVVGPPVLGRTLNLNYSSGLKLISACGPQWKVTTMHRAAPQKENVFSLTSTNTTVNAVKC